ncbi:MAG TPA: hypothetical protein VKB59_15340 [Micromonosporaceae bacterium]|nr:hypothetical protein [Micromonosporaceae bacterium]
MRFRRRRPAEQLRAQLEPIASRNGYAALFLLRLTVAADPDAEAAQILEELTRAVQTLIPAIAQVTAAIEAYAAAGIADLEREANR